MDECDFCRIVAGERDAHVLAETDRTMAFLDEHPAVEGHTLVVPRAHRESLFSPDDSMASAVYRTVQHVVTAMEETLAPDGVSTFHTTGRLAGSVTHAHVHLLPRYVDDDVHLALARDDLDEDDAAALARRLREHV